MKAKSVALVIMWWIETIVSIRVLLFTVPVLISQRSAQTLDLNDINDRFIVICTVVALIYVLVGIVSIFRAGSGWVKHVAAAVLAAAVNIGPSVVLPPTTGTISVPFYAPVIVAAVFSVLTLILGSKR